jgi:hypothetical protein
VAGCCEYGNGQSGSIKRGQFVDLLSGYQLLKRTQLHGVSCVEKIILKK